MQIVKNTKLQYHTECPGSPSDGLIFTVSKVGAYRTKLKPENENEFNPSFEINNTDLDMAINAGYYSIIN
jgi:hypothetical protein